MSRALLALCLIGSLGGCAGSLGGQSLPDGGAGTGAVRGRVVLGSSPEAGVTIMARSRALRTTTAADGSFQIGGLAAGPATIVAFDSLGQALIATAAVLTSGTTDLGDLTLQASAFSSLVGLQGFGFEERVTSGRGDLSNPVFTSDGKTAFALRAGAMVKLDVETGFERSIDLGVPLPPPGQSLSFQLVADRALLVLTDSAYAIDIAADLSRQRPPNAIVGPAPGWLRYWVAGSSLYFLSGVRNAGTGGPVYSVTRVDLSNKLGDAFVQISRTLAGGRPIVSLGALVSEAGGDILYVPNLGCATSPGCSAEESSDELADRARVVRLKLFDGSEELVGKVPNGAYAGETNAAGAIGGTGFYFLHRGAVTRVDLGSGAVRDVLVASGDTQQSPRLLAAPDESALILLGGATPDLVELPGLARHHLTYGGSQFQPLCCGGAAELRFAPGGGVLAASASAFPGSPGVATWVDFLPSGAVQRARSLTVPASPPGQVPRLLVRPDGTELAVGHTSLAEGGHDHVFAAGPGPGEVKFSRLTLFEADHTSAALSADGAWVYFLMRDPLRGDVQLFRLALP